MDDATRYAALAARDVRFDGLFFVGVATTGVYCRPICPARLPAEENCEFFDSAARAELAGFRACFRCRPELAPGDSSVDATATTARRAARLIMRGVLDHRSLGELADTLGVSDRHLRRVMVDELGVTPVQLAQTHRLGVAKRLLQDTSLPITTVAAASGFGSVRRFNALFRERFERAPSDVRRHASSDEHFVAQLAFRPPFQWEKLLEFIAGRGTPGVVAVHDGVYDRSLRIDDALGLVRVRRVTEDRLEAEIALSLAPHLSEVIARLRHLFDLDCRPDVIAAHFHEDDVLGRVAARLPGLRVPGAIDGFELAVRIVLGQQVSVAGATTIAGRFAEAFGVRDDVGRLYFPSRAEVASLEPARIQALGMPTRRARTIVEMAQCDASFDPAADAATTVAELLAVHGIGPWTANYIVMRALRSPDAYPENDLVLDRRGGTVSQAERWRPWRSYAAMYLWNKQEDE